MTNKIGEVRGLQDVGEPIKQASLICEQACPLCGSQGGTLFHQDAHRRSTRPYYQCPQCTLVYVPRAYYLSSDDEKAEYDLHENQEHDDGYRQFLMRFWVPFKAMIPAESSILEFGCGPGPVLAGMMIRDGYKVALYDHFYRPDQAVLTLGSYDGISSTEVFEHLHQPRIVLESLLNYLKSGGVLGLMTKLVTQQAQFANWHYKNDLTHVCFYSERTFQWIAGTYDLTLTFSGRDVILLKKGK